MTTSLFRLLTNPCENLWTVRVNLSLQFGLYGSTWIAFIFSFLLLVSHPERASSFLCAQRAAHWSTPSSPALIGRSSFTGTSNSEQGCRLKTDTSSSSLTYWWSVKPSKWKRFALTEAGCSRLWVYVQSHRCFCLRVARSANNFKQKAQVRVCQMWTAGYTDEVCEGSTSPERSFVMGWPTCNYVATFR